MRTRIKRSIEDTSLLLRSIPSPVVTFLVLSVVLLVVLWRFFKGVLRRLRLLRGAPPQEAMEALPAQ